MRIEIELELSEPKTAEVLKRLLITNGYIAEWYVDCENQMFLYISDKTTHEYQKQIKAGE